MACTEDVQNASCGSISRPVTEAATDGRRIDLGGPLFLCNLRELRTTANILNSETRLFFLGASRELTNDPQQIDLGSSQGTN